MDEWNRLGLQRCTRQGNPSLIDRGEEETGSIARSSYNIRNHQYSRKKKNKNLPSKLGFLTTRTTNPRSGPRSTPRQSNTKREEGRRLRIRGRGRESIERKVDGYELGEGEKREYSAPGLRVAGGAGEAADAVIRVRFSGHHD
jgi:hypothetical protein